MPPQPPAPGRSPWQPVETGEQHARSVHGRAEPFQLLAQGPVRREHLDRPGLGIVGDEGEDAVVGGVGARPPGVEDPHPGVVAFGQVGLRPSVENQRHLGVGGGPEPLQARPVGGFFDGQVRKDNQPGAAIDTMVKLGNDFMPAVAGATWKVTLETGGRPQERKLSQ